MGCGKNLRRLLGGKKKKECTIHSETHKQTTGINGKIKYVSSNKNKGAPDSNRFSEPPTMNGKISALSAGAETVTSPLLAPASARALAEQQKLNDSPDGRVGSDTSREGLLETEAAAFEPASAQDIERRISTSTAEVDAPLSPPPNIAINESREEWENKFDEEKYGNQQFSKSGSPQETGAVPRIGFHPGVRGGDEDGDEEDEKGHDRRRRRMKACRGIRVNKSSDIVVKYTKVYGESDGAYKNDSTPRGLVFMVNFTNYEANEHPEREGSNKDFYNMLNLFQKIGYETSHRTDKYCHTGHMTRDTFLKRLKDFSEEKRHKMLCSCIIIIMGHGSGPKTFLTSDNQEVDLMEVYDMLNNINCQNLRGKPKIFILQFCRNSPKRIRDTPCLSPLLDPILIRNLIREEVQHAIEEQFGKKWGDGDPVIDIDVRSPRFLTLLENSESTSVASFGMDQPSMQNNESSYPGNNGRESPDAMSFSAYQTDTRNLPPPPPQEGVQRFSDMYSIFSTTSGELSHRDPRKGSLLIQAICHVFAEYAYQDEIDILVRKVSLYMTKTLQKDDPIHVPRQTCERTNNGLDKYFYFNPEFVAQCRHVTI